MSNHQNNTNPIPQEHPPMDIDVRIYKPRAGGRSLATASVTLNGCFTIRGVEIVQGNNGPFVSMPSYHSKDGYHDHCFPCTKDFKAQFDRTVLDAYEQHMEHGRQQEPDQRQTGPAMGGMAM